MVDFRLGPDEQDLVALAAHFARTRVAPALTSATAAGAAGQLDRDAFRALVRDAAAAGLLGLLVPTGYGGGGQGALAAALVGEELGAVDAGVAAALNLTMSVPAMVAAAGTDAQRESVLRAVAGPDGLLVAGALSETDVAGSELFDPAPTPDRGIRTRATRDGDGWLLTGTKSGWVTNAGVADAYLVFARTDPHVPAVAGSTAFWVPADTPGVSVGPRTAFLGLHGSWHAELLLDGVRLPADAVVGPVGGALPLMQTSTPAMVVGLAGVFVGVARTALRMSLDHTSSRRSWGRPLREHQAVALRLADADAGYRRARLLVWQAATLVDEVTAGRADPADLGVLLPQCKEQAVQAAIDGAGCAVMLHGAAGVAVGAGPEKLLRDAWTGYACDFTGDLLRLATAAALR